MKKALLVFALALSVAPVTQAAGHVLPARGELAPGLNLAGIRIGDSVARVTQVWGTNYTVCGECKTTTWYFFYPTAEPLGAAVKFRSGHVVAAFTLGSPTGWHTREGLLMGDEAYNISQLYGQLVPHACIGYGALSMRKGNTVTSIYTTGESVYGFAITAPAEPVCQ